MNRYFTDEEIYMAHKLVKIYTASLVIREIKQQNHREILFDAHLFDQKKKAIKFQ